MLRSDPAGFQFVRLIVMLFCNNSLGLHSLHVRRSCVMLKCNRGDGDLLLNSLVSVSACCSRFFRDFRDGLCQLIVD